MPVAQVQIARRRRHEGARAASRGIVVFYAR
jgi:hypothetical protein